MKTTNHWKNLSQGNCVIPLLLVALSICLQRVAFADTPVSGTIVGQTWTATNSPYVVVGDILANSLEFGPSWP